MCSLSKGFKISLTIALCIRCNSTCDEAYRFQIYPGLCGRKTFYLDLHQHPLIQVLIVIRNFGVNPNSAINQLYILTSLALLVDTKNKKSPVQFLRISRKRNYEHPPS